MTEYRLHGPPGCGKTASLARVWVPKAAKRFGPENVAVFSLTRSAAIEIASRVDLPRENVGTLHALCYRGLDRPVIAETKIGEWNETHRGYGLTGKSQTTDDPGVEKPRALHLGDRLMSEAQLLRHRMVPRDRWPRHVVAFQGMWERWQREHGYVDFTGLIETALAELEVAPGHPSVLIGDEIQDSSGLELALVRKWSRHADYAVLCGDSDQAIFSWRGADPRAFLEPPIPDGHNYLLTKSFRVPRAVHAAAVRWIGQASYRYAVDYEPRDAEGQVSVAGNLRFKYPETVLGAIERELEDDRTVMVLTACAYMLVPLLRLFRREGFPFHNPYRPDEHAWNPLETKRKLLLAFLGIEASRSSPGGSWSCAELNRWIGEVNPKTALRKGARKLVKKRSEDRALFGPQDAVKVFQPEAWASLEKARVECQLMRWLRTYVRPKKRKSWEFAFRIAEKRGTAVLLATPRIKVGTVHSSKGGEDTTVFLFPDLSRAGMRGWLSRGDRHDEIVRTFYVGMTRARERLVLCGPSSPYMVRWLPAGSGVTVAG